MFRAPPQVLEHGGDVESMHKLVVVSGASSINWVRCKQAREVGRVHRNGGRTVKLTKRPDPSDDMMGYLLLDTMTHMCIIYIHEIERFESL